MKIAAFVVVNAFGSIVDRQGNLVSCHPATSWGGTPKIADLMLNAPASRDPDWRPSDAGGNTTVSLIVTNRKLSYAELQRLAIQVHTSMARAIQPFSTQQARVFQEYYQLGNPERDRAKGLGLGLAIVRRLADRLACQLTLRSKPDKGSCFEVVIPLANKTGSAEAPQLEAPQGSQASLLIVVIDDELAIREAMSGLLTSWGHRVIAAGSCDEAIRRLSTCPSPARFPHLRLSPARRRQWRRRDRAASFGVQRVYPRHTQRRHVEVAVQDQPDRGEEGVLAR